MMVTARVSGSLHVAFSEAMSNALWIILVHEMQRHHVVRTWKSSLQAYGSFRRAICSGDLVDGHTAMPLFASK